jgi:hypothetical protein
VLKLGTNCCKATASVLSGKGMASIPSLQANAEDEDVVGELRSLAVLDDKSSPSNVYDSLPSSPGSDSSPTASQTEQKTKGGYFSFLKRFPSLKSKSKERDKDDDGYKKLAAKLPSCRHVLAHPDGGIKNTDLEGIRISRSVITEIVKQVGPNRRTLFCITNEC